MSNALDARMLEIAARAEARAESLVVRTVSIRVSPNSYAAALFVALFFSGFLFYIEQEAVAGVLLLLGVTIIPALAWFDRISFDGRRLTRTGLLPRAWAAINDSRSRLRLGDIEQVETHALRALKRGGNVFYRYRTAVHGKGQKFVFASGGAEYRDMVHKLFPLVAENALDQRSIELRDFLADPKETLMKAEFARIPSAEVLEDSLSKFSSPLAAASKRRDNRQIGPDEEEKAEYLRTLANELRLGGFLIQALEAFRRSLVINPDDARTLFEYARCLHSYAGSERDAKLQKKAFAAMRLAERKGRSDAEFLERLGESYFQYGEWQRAQKVFNRAMDLADESYRSVRGLAELALRDGKLAHVIHHFGAASRLAETAALRRWTRTESEYFARLNSDDEYMELEVSRVKMVENLDEARKTSLRIAVFGMPVIIFGVLFGEVTLGNIGWAVSSIAVLIWIGLVMSRNLLSNRIPPELVEED